MYKQKIDNENENKQDEKELDNYKTHEYFINVLNSINPEDIKQRLDIINICF